MVSDWTNDRAIQKWGTMPRAVLDQTARDGDFAKRHLINPVLLRMLADPRASAPTFICPTSSSSPHQRIRASRVKDQIKT